MEKINFNKYTKFIFESFEKEINNYKNQLFKKINLDLVNFKNDIMKSSFILFEDVSNNLNPKPNDKIENFSDNFLKNFKNFKIININVGGKVYPTAISTLEKYPNSLFNEISNLEKNFKIPVNFQDNEGNLFIDRNPKYFDYVLDAMRNGKFIKTQDSSLNSYVEEELKYFNLENLNEDFNENYRKVETQKELEYLTLKNEIINGLEYSGIFDEQNKEIFKIENIINQNFEAKEKKNLISEINKKFNKIVSPKNEFTKETIKFSFDIKFKNPNLNLFNENLSVMNVVGWDDASVLGNIEMSNGKYQWEVYVDSLQYDNYLTLGICEKSEISREMKNEHINSWSISSTKESWRMEKPINNLKQKNSYILFLDFDNDLFRIIGTGIDCKNEVPIKNRNLYFLVNVFNSKNKITIKNYRKIVE